MWQLMWRGRWSIFITA
ncbi:unnamed protein product [Linum tenue]|uniref:Uncharacterized protein n=1 Tax=Linum tenue TaxID=586396 RepID=A0AAV0LCQ8_9ROSI|nr:unnamed protein product [Linum tenue]